MKPFTYWLAHVYVALCDYDQALPELETDQARRAIEMVHVNLDPAFDPIHGHPRFKAILKEMNFQ